MKGLILAKRAGIEIREISLQIRDMLRELHKWEHSRSGNNEALSKKDDGVGFLVSALDEFIDGKYGQRFFNNFLHRLASAEQYALQDYERAAARLEIKATFGSHIEAMPDKDMFGIGFLNETTYEIITSVIYEVLNLFDLDITLEQVVSTRAHTPLTLKLLQEVYELRKQNLKLQPPKTNLDEVPNPSDLDITLEKVLSCKADIPSTFKLLQEVYEELRKQNRNLQLPKPNLDSQPSTSTENTWSYEYPSVLGAGEIRLLEILPGIGEGKIECRLKVYKLGEGCVPEALSYVWGRRDQPKGKILVDQKDFTVLGNLHRALRGLRLPETARVIWVDAICINQADGQERAHQVSLMGQLYSEAKTTTIWLDDSSLDVEGSPDTAGWLAPLPPRFGGHDIDGDDYVAIINEYSKYCWESEWDEKQLAIYLMFHRCRNRIRMNEWWERIWTIQEAALPRQPPNLIFKGRCIPFDQIILAVYIVL
ncbi:heterokaryon incompatibility protein-domain-containing protein [Nemania sp. FL0031]|nr:heterokaryon incompatibility protein-domain-containing protein [Nemania sp. FL0031]